MYLPTSRAITNAALGDGGRASNGVRCPRAVVFDLDNTLSESFQPPAPHVAERLRKLLKLMPVAIMSGASLSRMEQDLLPSLSGDISKAELYLFTDTASQCFTSKNGGWSNLYKNALTEDECATIIRLVKEGLLETAITQGAPLYGDQFLARDTQITFSAIGTYAPAGEKVLWDPLGTKRKKLVQFLAPKLPGFNILLGGRTAIDITRKGIDKAYGVQWLAKRLGLKPSEMLFVGDALYPGGNDAIVIPTGIQTIDVAGPHETAKVIDELLAACAK
ncbi:MAG: HAD-IIB family hydrolase [Patescibacteria group bacterium]